MRAPGVHGMRVMTDCAAPAAPRTSSKCPEINGPLRAARLMGLRALERETGVEPATSTLARWRSTTELFPPARGSGDRKVPGLERAEE